MVIHGLSFVGYEGIAESGEEARLEHTSACPLLWFLVIHAYIIIVIIIISSSSISSSSSSFILVPLKFVGHNREVRIVAMFINIWHKGKI
jgi:hypothetical protein